MKLPTRKYISSMINNYSLLYYHSLSFIIMNIQFVFNSFLSSFLMFSGHCLVVMVIHCHLIVIGVCHQFPLFVIIVGPVYFWFNEFSSYFCIQSSVFFLLLIYQPGSQRERVQQCSIYGVTIVKAQLTNKNKNCINGLKGQDQIMKGLNAQVLKKKKQDSQGKS